MSASPEEIQRKLVELKLAQLEARKAELEKPTNDALTSGAGGFSRGVLQAVGLPVDLMNAAAGLVGLDVEEPVGGFKFLNRVASQVNVGQVGRDTFAGRVGESIGAGSAGLGVLGAAARLSSGAGPLLQSFRSAPLRFSGLETSASAGGGLGAATAQEFFPESRLAEAGGEVAGALANPVNVAASVASAARRKLRSTADLFTRTGQERRAGRDLLANAEDPQAVERLIGNQEFQASPLTPAQASQDRGLMTLERSAARFSAEAERRYADTVDEINAAIRTQLDDVSDVGQPLAARQVLDAEVRRLDELLTANVDASLLKARDKIDDLGGIDVVSRTRANTIVRQQLEQARAASRSQERQLWESIPGQALAGTRTSEAGYEAIIAARPRTAAPEDIPAFVHEFLKAEKGATKLGGSEGRATVDELLGLRSRMLDAASAEEALGKGANRNKIRILNELQEDVLDDLGQLGDEAVGLPQDVAEAVTKAREFSRLHNDKFSRGDVGRVFGRSRDRGPSIAPELTAETLVGRSSPQAGVNADALMKATGNSPEMQQALREHIQQRFLTSATDATGVVIPTRAETFLRNNSQLLDRFPDIRRQLEDSAFSQRTALDVQRTAQAQRAVLHDQNRSVAALFLNARPSREINRILEASPEPVAALKDLKALMSGDAAGEAGLKGAFVREMIGRSELSRLDATGRPGFDGNRFRQEVTKTAKIGESAGILSAEDVKRMSTIADIAQKAQAPSRVQVRNLSDLIGTDIGTGMFDLLTRISAANVGAQSVIGKSSGASLVTAGFTVRWARRLLAQTPSVKIRDILAESMFDKDLFELLLKRAKSPEQAVQFSQRLNAFLINLGIDRQEEVQ